MEGAFSEICPIGEHVTDTPQVRCSLAALGFTLPSRPPGAQLSLGVALVPQPCLCFGPRLPGCRDVSRDVVDVLEGAEIASTFSDSKASCYQFLSLHKA